MSDVWDPWDDEVDDPDFWDPLTENARSEPKEISTVSNIWDDLNVDDSAFYPNEEVGAWGSPPDVSNKPTCGPLFERSLELIYSAWRSSALYDDPTYLITAGHAMGQAEKVYLGACQAAMFRPSTRESRDLIFKVCLHLSSVYGLEISVFERAEIADEIWLHQSNPRVKDQISRLSSLPYNSWQWHTLRGRLCGVPENEIDHQFHLRKGFGEPCDRVSAQTPKTA